MRLKSWALACALFAASLPALAQDFQGKVIFSVEVVEWALERNADGSKGPKQRTGVFYYYKEAGADGFGPSITGYKLRNGEVVGVTGGGGDFVKSLSALATSTFNVQTEIDATIENLRAEAKRNGQTYWPPATLDGAKYRIRYDFNGASIDHTAWNPGSVIDGLAPHSTKLKGLKELLDFFAVNYGRREFGL